MKVTILTEKDLRKCVTLDHKVITAIENAFTWLTEDKVFLPPIMHIGVPENKGDVDIKSAHVRGVDKVAVKLGAGFFENHRIGLPNATAMVVLLSAKTGFVEAILLDNGYLTDVRTGAAGAVAAKHLAPKNVETVGQIGTGAQGRYQMKALHIIRDFKHLIAYDVNSDRLEQYVKEMSEVLGIQVSAASEVDEVVRKSQIVVTSTPSRKPYLKKEWLHPGLHITCMGADLPEKQELEPEILKNSDILVCDRKSQCFEMGELHHGLKAKVLSESSNIFELGELTSGRVKGRQNDDQITICDLTGTGVQDTAICLMAYQKATIMGLGIQVENEISQEGEI